jgi:hypothetical protein
MAITRLQQHVRRILSRIPFVYDLGAAGKVIRLKLIYSGDAALPVYGTK